jgi:Zn-dependent protease with chaperone function
LGYVVQFFAAFLTLGLADLAWRDGTFVLAWLPLAFLGPHVAAFLARRAFARGRLRIGAALERGIVVAPIAIQAAAVLLGWLEALRASFGIAVPVEGWPGLGLVAGLAPFLLAQCLAIDARARLFGRNVAERHTARVFQLRLFASTITPFLVYLAAASLIGLSETWRVRVEEISLLSALFTLGILAVFVFLLPELLRLTWDTVPLEPGSERAELEELARRARFACRDLLVWRTGNQVANAAIVGFLPANRLVLFSDALLAELGPREVAGVFAHEIGHARRRHMLLFVCHVLGFVLGAQVLLDLAGTPSLEVEVAILGAVSLGWFVSFGWLSRRVELEADLESLELLGESGPLVRALVGVSGAHAHRKASWRYFSTGERVRFLLKAEANPSIGRRLRRKVRLVGAASALLFMGVAGYELRGRIEALGEERVVVDLRLGRYDEARAGLARARTGDVDLAALVDEAAGLASEERSPQKLEEAALHAATRGDLPKSARLVQLALLRGRDDLEPVLAWLEAVERGEAAVSTDALPEPWRRLRAPSQARN